MILPRGTQLELRASYLRWNRGSTAHDVTFELAFTLGGPVAYNIFKDDQQSERIKVYMMLVPELDLNHKYSFDESFQT